MKDYAKILAAQGVPLPVGDIIDARWKARSGDWYVKTSQQGWLWLDTREASWKPVQDPDR